jgi:hypothetical protein
VRNSNNGLSSDFRRRGWRQILTPRFIVLLAVASVVNLLLAVRFISVVIFVDVCVVSLLLPERFISILARLVAGACILLLGLTVCVQFYYAYSQGFAVFARFPFLWRFLFPDWWSVVFSYGLPLFLAFAVVAIEKRRFTRKTTDLRSL